MAAPARFGVVRALRLGFRLICTAHGTESAKATGVLKERG